MRHAWKATGTPTTARLEEIQVRDVQHRQSINDVHSCLFCIFGYSDVSTTQKCLNRSPGILDCGIYVPIAEMAFFFNKKAVFVCPEEMLICPVMPGMASL